MVWSPLAGGGRFHGEDERSRRVRLALHGIAAEMNTTPDTIALAWLLHHPVQPVPVLGTGNREHILNAVRACTRNMPRETWFGLLVASQGIEVP
nr:aldo/keto reductase [Ardenticatena sp.]